MRESIGLDVGSGLVKIAVVRNNRVYKTQVIESDNKDLKSIAYQVKQFLQKNRIKPRNVNVMVKDYKTRRTKMERVRNYELKNALLYEREEKIGTSDMLGRNYRDNHIIQKKNNKTLDILLAVINEEELNRIDALMEAVNIPDANIYMECFLYSDIVGDDTVIIDIGHSSIQIMFLDRKKVIKTSLLKKGIKDIIEDLKGRVDPGISFKDLKQFSFEDQDDEKYNTMISWLGLFADNIISSLSTYARENMKSVSSLNVFYTGGLFTIPRMAEYFNYLMEVEGRLLRVCGQKEDPVYNNSIALAFKTSKKGRIERGYGNVFTSIKRFASCLLILSLTVLLTWGGYNYYQYYSLAEADKSVREAYDGYKKDFDSLYSAYSQLDNLLTSGSDRIEAYRETSSLGKRLEGIKRSLNRDVSMKKLEFRPGNLIVIEGTSNSYTSLGIFCAQLRKVFREVEVADLKKADDKTVGFRLECML